MSLLGRLPGMMRGKPTSSLVADQMDTAVYDIDGLESEDEGNAIRDSSRQPYMLGSLPNPYSPGWTPASQGSGISSAKDRWLQPPSLRNAKRRREDAYSSASDTPSPQPRRHRPPSATDGQWRTPTMSASLQIARLVDSSVEQGRRLNSLEDRFRIVERFPDRVEEMIESHLGELGQDDEELRDLLRSFPIEIRAVHETIKQTRKEVDEARSERGAIDKLEARIRELEQEKRDEREAMEREREVERAEREKAKEDKASMAKRLDESTRAVNHLENQLKALREDLSRRQDEVVKTVEDRVSALAEANDGGLEDRLDPIIKKLETVQALLERNPTSGLSSQTPDPTHRLLEPPSSIGPIMKVQGAVSTSNRVFTDLFHKESHLIEIDYTDQLCITSSLASIGVTPTGVDEDCGRGEEATKMMVVSASALDMDDFVNDTGEYTNADRSITCVNPKDLRLTRVESQHDRDPSKSIDPVDPLDQLQLATDLDAPDHEEQFVVAKQMDNDSIQAADEMSDESHARLRTPQSTNGGDLANVAGFQTSGEEQQTPTTPRRSLRSRRPESQTILRHGREISIASTTSSFEAAMAARRANGRLPFPPRRRGRPPKEKPRTKLRQRRSFGSRPKLTVKTLGRGNGMPRGNGEWPPKMEYTILGRAQEIVCDICKGRVHWFCAGLADDQPAPEGEWHCPDCQAKLKAGRLRGTIDTAPQLYCIRWNCLMRAKTRTVRKEGDEEHYYPECILGRRATSRNEDSTRNFEYLIKWEDWPIEDSTWEPPENFKNQAYMIDDLMTRLQELGLPTGPKVNLLPQAKKHFDAFSGDILAGDDEEQVDDQKPDEKPDDLDSPQRA